MTCIAGVLAGNRTYIGGDSAGTAGDDLIIRADQKVFRNGEFLIGFAGSFRMGQLLRFAFVPPKHPKRQDTYRYMVTTFVDAVRDCLKKGGLAQKEHDVEEVEGILLVGYRGRLFIVDCDYSVAEPVDGFAAVGCGCQVANGALYVTEGMEPKKRVRQALDAAERHCNAVRRPFYVQVIDKEETETA